MAVDIVRAWKDAKYRESLTPEELASLPLSPAGYPELTAEQMEGVVGGVGGRSFGSRIPALVILSSPVARIFAIGQRVVRPVVILFIKKK